MPPPIKVAALSGWVKPQLRDRFHLGDSRLDESHSLLNGLHRGNRNAEAVSNRLARFSRRSQSIPNASLLLVREQATAYASRVALRAHDSPDFADDIREGGNPESRREALNRLRDGLTASGILFRLTLPRRSKLRLKLRNLIGGHIVIAGVLIAVLLAVLIRAHVLTFVLFFVFFVFVSAEKGRLIPRLTQSRNQPYAEHSTRGFEGRKTFFRFFRKK